MNALQTKVSEQSTEALKVLAALLYDDTRLGADEVFGAVTAELEKRLLEADFVAFCAELEA